MSSKKKKTAEPKVTLFKRFIEFVKTHGMKLSLIAMVVLFCAGTYLLTAGIMSYKATIRENYVVAGIKALQEGNIHKSQSILLKAAKGGAPEAYPYLAWVSAKSGSFSKALEYCRECAKYKNMYGAYEIMGYLALLGYGNAQGAGSAVYFFNEALKGYSEEYIEQNNPILKMFEKAIPLCMSTQDYIRMVEESKNAGSVEALLYRGDIDFLGEEHDISPRSAVKSWELAKNKGIVQAQSRLAAVLWHGYGCPRNFQEAIRLYTEAAKQGDPVANYSLGLIRFRQGKGSSYAEGLRLMKAAAKNNYGPAMTAVGVMALSHNYENSQKIVVAAADIFKQAYECGDSTGGILYALMLLSGTGVPKDSTTGFAILYDLKSRSVKAVDALLKYYTYTSTNESNRIFSQAIELCKAMYLGNVCFSEGAPEAKVYLAKDKKNPELSYFVSIKDEKIFMTDDLRSFLGRNYVRILDDPKDLTIRGKPLVYPELYEILEIYNPTTGAKPFMPNMVLSINASVPPLPRAYDKYNLDLSLIDNKL